MMKTVHTLFAICIDLAARLASVFFRLQLIEWLKLFLNKTQWHALSRGFGSIGDGSYIEAPFHIKNPHHMQIGKNFSALSTFTMEAWDEYRGEAFSPQIIIGDNVSFYHDCHVACINRIEIEDNVLLASKVYITDHFHGTTAFEDLKLPPAARKLSSKGPVKIERNAWIGENVAIMPGVTIGANAIIGANSVVTRDIPSNAVATGVPAKIIKMMHASEMQ